MVVSFIPGRIRLRFRELKNPGIGELVKSRITGIPGIRGVTIHTSTGSILIEYDTAVLPTAKLVELGRRELAALAIPLDLPNF